MKGKGIAGGGGWELRRPSQGALWGKRHTIKYHNTIALVKGKLVKFLRLMVESG
jgi:hypothetical protein